MTLKDLRDKRLGLWNEARQIMDSAEAAKRAMTQEEENRFDAINSDMDRLDADIARAESFDERRQRYDTSAPRDSRELPGGDDSETAEVRYKRLAVSRNRFYAGGLGALSADERRDLQADSGPGGGYLVPGPMFVDELIKAVDDMTFMRGLSRAFAVGMHESLGAPSLDADPDDGTWGTELQVATADTAMTFGRRELKPKDLTLQMKVSRKLLSKSSAESIVLDRIAYKQSLTEEKAFLTGDGATQPLGVFTASTQGISTGRDVSTGNTATSITFDGLWEAYFSLKAQYTSRATWIFHRAAVKQIRKLKDGEGQYIWQAGGNGVPATICDRPYKVSEHAPSTFTTGLYVGILGDFSRYWIADGIDGSIQRLDELYAASNQIGFIYRGGVDGMPVLEESFARVKLG